MNVFGLSLSTMILDHISLGFGPLFGQYNKSVISVWDLENCDVFHHLTFYGQSDESEKKTDSLINKGNDL